MNWEALGAAAEFLGSVVVLITLVFIAFQVRESRKMNAILLSIARTDNVAGRIANSSDLAGVLAKVRQKTGGAPAAVSAAEQEWGLSPAEAEMWFRYMGTVWRGFEAQFRQGDDIRIPVQRITRDPQQQFYLNHAKEMYDQKFLDAVSSYISERQDAEA